MEERTVFTLKQAAELLNCHTETLRRAIKDGHLFAAKIGKEYRISKTDLEDYWTAKGGGALFDDSPRPERPAVKNKKDKGGPEQFKLPT
ncbi:helix-turn-helix domain-containing protein [Oceanidesulfovibrio marinus]|uniref:Helix-turn-helix domain-containing protein n=1 Tax=Oceanidesulfovibrio marinus TaxID=370038 RepID=A0ABX6NJ62_9BACT|nr:helix-turn-helix domain-containing protein [Oceanidesulfovibrio marinus]QJT10681.1 helix-turn-helix domain-containing protein [Oceanidesulfovibrio marinus]